MVDLADFQTRRLTRLITLNQEMVKPGGRRVFQFQEENGMKRAQVVRT